MYSAEDRWRRPCYHDSEDMVDTLRSSMRCQDFNFSEEIL